MIKEQQMGQSIRIVDNKYSIVTIYFTPGKEPPSPNMQYKDIY